MKKFLSVKYLLSLLNNAQKAVRRFVAKDLFADDANVRANALSLVIPEFGSTIASAAQTGMARKEAAGKKVSEAIALLQAATDESKQAHAFIDAVKILEAGK